MVLDKDHTLQIIEKDTYQSGNEGLNIWEAGIQMARYFVIQAPDTVRGETIVELGSGTGVTGAAMLKHT